MSTEKRMSGDTLVGALSANPYIPLGSLMRTRVSGIPQVATAVGTPPYTQLPDGIIDTSNEAGAHVE